jgi:Bacterial regulatory proteins, luxR family
MKEGAALPCTGSPRPGDAWLVRVGRPLNLAFHSFEARIVAAIGNGQQLHVSHNTIHSHVRSIYRKLGVSSRAHALQRTRELRLL